MNRDLMHHMADVLEHDAEWIDADEVDLYGESYSELIYEITRNRAVDFFSMDVFLERGECGTVGCLAAWAVSLSGCKAPPFASNVAVMARKELDLTEKQAMAIFDPQSLGLTLSYRTVQPEMCAGMLRTVAELEDPVQAKDILDAWRNEMVEFGHA